MGRLVTKFQYLRPSNRRRVGSYAQYIATREGAECPKKFYADYIATRPRAERLGAHALFSDAGKPLQLSKVSAELNSYPGNVWTAIVSLRREDAERLGYNSAGRWRDMLRSQTQAFSEALHIPLQNLQWYAAFHNESHHPHVHVILCSAVPTEGYLSRAGIEKLRASLAADIFSEDLHNTYQRQTEHRDALRTEFKKKTAEIVAKINDSTYSNPQLEVLLLQLAGRLRRTSGKKVYGYLKPGVKALVDSIVEELASDERIALLYELWYRQREEVLRIYTDELPERVPLSQSKEFKPIRNAVIQEALNLMSAPETLNLVPGLVPMEVIEMPAEQYKPEALAMQYDSGLRPNVSPSLCVLRLFRQLAGAFRRQEDDRQKVKQHLRTERKLLQKIEEKRQAHGLKHG